MTDDPLRRAILAALGPRPSAARRRSLAAQLRQLAAEQETLVEAMGREQARPPLSRARHGRGGRPSAHWVRVERSARRQETEVRVLLARKLYYDAGRPERLDVQLVGGVLRLVPIRAGDAGYKVIANAGGVRINVSGARDLVSLEDGRYAASLAAGAIVVGARMR